MKTSNNGLTDRTAKQRTTPLPLRKSVVNANGNTLTAQGIANAEAGADADWLAAALDAVHTVAREQESFTTDDVWERLGGAATTAENRAMGPIMQRAARLKYCAPSSYTKTTRRASNHNRPLRVWTSLLHFTSDF